MNEDIYITIGTIRWSRDINSGMTITFGWAKRIVMIAKRGRTGMGIVNRPIKR